ncbi:DegT/DnrJ/EryC1/StrS family aminotransferase [Oscillatoria acuminata]|uniref:DegT/DnrJ/EryC1/StrS family aminotransferase n=1 Tax=Oscillatoria acuminata TaxID=118323 RepID=UPI0002F9F8FC|nr:DegT/DnrJ/EryC1/StrS family aminotransferase [Oscillatoria acuminata]
MKIPLRIKSRMLIRLSGQSAAMEQIMDMAQDYGLKVIEDSAQSFGATNWGNCSSCQGHCQEPTLESRRGNFARNFGDVGA